MTSPSFITILVIIIPVIVRIKLILVILGFYLFIYSNPLSELINRANY